MLNDGYLAHYGVKGMRWGVRKAEVRSDNRMASALGKKATYDQYAYDAAQRRANKYTKKYENSNKERHQRKLKAAIESRDLLKKNSEKSTADMKRHRDSLVKKYGKENVKDIKYNKRGFIDEGKDFERSLASAGLTAVSLAIAMSAGLHFAPVAVSRSSSSIGANMEAASYRQQLLRDRENKNRG